jgi:hypothetical protein
MEPFAQSSDCLSSLVNDADKMERLEVVCDMATHYLCHQCAHCQKGRELCCHLGFFARRPVYATAPPSEQRMGCGAPTWTNCKLSPCIPCFIHLEGSNHASSEYILHDAVLIYLSQLLCCVAYYNVT